MTGRSLRRVSAAADFGRVAVLYGGQLGRARDFTAQRAAVLAALKRRGVDAHGFDPAQASSPPCAATALRAPGSRCMFRVARTARCRVRWNFLAFPTRERRDRLGDRLDKLRTKRLAGASGVPTPEFVVLRQSARS